MNLLLPCLLLTRPNRIFWFVEVCQQHLCLSQVLHYLWHHPPIQILRYRWDCKFHLRPNKKPKSSLQAWLTKPWFEKRSSSLSTLSQRSPFLLWAPMTSPHLTSPKCRIEVGEARVGRLSSHSGLTVIPDEMICTTWQKPAGGGVPYWQETQSNLTVPFQGRSTTHGGHLTPSTGVETVMPGYSGVESFPLISNFSWGHVSTYQ
jgi:hypothetical protein